MFTVLPSDVLLHILLFLGSSDIARIHVLSHDSHKFLVDHESEVYHQLAISCRFALSGCSLKDAILPETHRDSSWLRGVDTWKEFVRRWTILERNWSGRGAVLEGGHLTFNTHGNYDTREFAVDEDDSTIILNFMFNMLIVIGMNDNRRLWQIPGVVCFKWSEGFLAFINGDGKIEIWRRTTDVEYHLGKPILTPILPPSRIATIPAQYKKADNRGVEYLTTPTYGNLRGKYTPHAFISTPSYALPQAFFLKYPVVSFIAATRPYTIHMYDIAEGAHIRSVDIEKMLESRGHPPSVMDVFFAKPPTDLCLSDTYVAVSFESFALIIAIRKADEQHFNPIIIYETENPILVKKSAYHLNKVTLPQASRCPEGPSFILESGEELCTLDYIDTAGTLAMDQFEARLPPEDETSANAGALIVLSTLLQASATFVSLQISQDERHLVMVTRSGLLYFLPDFNHVARGLKPLEQSIQRMNVGKPFTRVVYSRYSRRFAVKTGAGDTYIVDIEPTFHSPLFPLQTSPDLQNTSIHRLADFRLSKLDTLFTCTEFTRSRLWLLWSPKTLFEVAKKRLRHAASKEDDPEDFDESSLLPEYNSSSFRYAVCFIDFMSGI